MLVLAMFHCTQTFDTHHSVGGVGVSSVPTLPLVTSRCWRYHSSSTGYFPVRQAVQWPTLTPELFMELILSSFWRDAIPFWTADTSPSTVRY